MSTQVLSPGQIPDVNPEEQKPQEWRQNLNIHMICPDCQEVPPNLLDTQDGDTICDSCGLVLGARTVDTRSEWRTFANDDSNSDDPSRVGNAADPLFYGSQLETHIAWGDGGNRARELHRAQSKLATDSNNKYLKEAYSRMSTVCQSIHLTDDAVRMAQDIFKQIYDHKTFKGKNTSNTIAGCIFIACRRTKQDRTFKDITDATGVSKKETGKAFKTIEHFLREDKKAKVREAGGTSSAPVHTATDPAKLAERYCQDLLLPPRTCRIAVEVTEKLIDTGIIAGRSPISIAAVAVYFTAALMGQSKSPKEVGAVASVSDGTIRTSYKLVYAERERVMSGEKWLSEGGKLERLPSA